MTCSMPPGNTYRPSARTQEDEVVPTGEIGKFTVLPAAIAPRRYWQGFR
jgi:hypothetical protein